MFTRTIEVTETVHLRKQVDIQMNQLNVSMDYLEPYALVGAMNKTPDYEEAGWELVGSEGCTFKEKV